MPQLPGMCPGPSWHPSGRTAQGRAQGGMKSGQFQNQGHRSHSYRELALLAQPRDGPACLAGTGPFPVTQRRSPLSWQAWAQSPASLGAVGLGPCPSGPPLHPQRVSRPGASAAVQPPSLCVPVNRVMRASLAGRLCHHITFYVLVHRALLVGESWLTVRGQRAREPSGL